MRDERQYLDDIVEAAELIDQHVKSASLEEFRTNMLLQRAVLFNFTIIGEAANKLSKSTQELYPEIDWSAIIAFRNVIVHAYHSLSLETVWKAAKRRVIPLAEQIEAIIRHDFSQDTEESD
ncbi:MAG: DUF86 domain-containing protein [Chloracidobacterium sp.]|nr:DUF86 domain-containing protein [Chloracidobacterium sp.]